MGERYQHFGARAYDPLTCTFMQTDPLAEKYYGVSPYAYCGNNPVRFTDLCGCDWKDKVVGFFVGIATNVVPIAGARDIYSPSNPIDYNVGLIGADKTSSVIAVGLVAAGTASSSAGTFGTSAGVALSTTCVGAPEGLAVATVGASAIATGEATIMAGAYLAKNIENNSSLGYSRGATTNGKNEKHGDSGRSLSKAESRIQELERLKESASKKEQRAIALKIKNIKRNGQRNQKGEEHSRANKR